MSANPIVPLVFATEDAAGLEMSDLIPSGHVTYGDIIIAVSYRPDWWPHKRQRLHRFTTAFDVAPTLCKERKGWGTRLRSLYGLKSLRENSDLCAIGHRGEFPGFSPEGIFLSARTEDSEDRKCVPPACMLIESRGMVHSVPCAARLQLKLCPSKIGLSRRL